MRDHSSKWTTKTDKSQLDSSWRHTGREPRLREIRLPSLEPIRKVHGLHQAELQGVQLLSIYSESISIQN